MPDSKLHPQPLRDTGLERQAAPGPTCGHRVRLRLAGRPLGPGRAAAASPLLQRPSGEVQHDPGGLSAGPLCAESSQATWWDADSSGETERAKSPLMEKS